MFMEIAIGAVGIAIILMVGYIVLSNVRTALPSSSTVWVRNPCQGSYLNNTAQCNLTTYTDTVYGSIPGPISDNSSTLIQVANTGYTSGTTAALTTVFAGFSLIAVGIIILAAFGLINIFK